MRKIVLALVLVFLVSALVPSIVYGAETFTTLRIHYHRPDGAYEPWNLWIWPQGKEGQVYHFDEESSFGRTATVELPGVHTRVGFIVRTNAWAKDVEADRFMEGFVDNFKEIWLLSGDPTIYTRPPEGFAVEEKAFDGVELIVNYYRYDGAYEGWNLWIWPDTKEGKAYAFDAVTEYGLQARVSLGDLEDASRLGIIVRHSTENTDWHAKDGEQDRFIPLFRSDEEGKIEVWLMQSDARISYRESEVDKSPRIISASIDAPRIVTVEVNLPFALTEGASGFVLKKEREEVQIKELKPLGSVVGGSVRTVQLLLAEDVDLNAQYLLERPHYQPVELSFGQIFSSQEFEDQFHYAGDDLGATWSSRSTGFRLWAPTAREVALLIYEDGHESPGVWYPMVRAEKGTWVTVLPGDLHGAYYNYQVTVGDQTHVVMDPYAKAAGVNGFRGMVIDHTQVRPLGFEELRKPPFLEHVDAIIYELHVRDLSIHENAGITHKGTYLGVIEQGTIGPQGVKTGLSHLVELGITHLHLLPVFDFHTIDETRLDVPQFNWGYDPQNYNVPEGSYSSNPFDGAVRVLEFKEMVQGLNEAGIRVVMDVVYNHTSKSADSHLNRIVPGYYYRMNPDGSFSNGSGCGNELADERSMVRKMIVDSVVFWATEYRVDGFRFDLMGLHHIDTMNAIRQAVDEVDPSIILYGEGWQGGPSLLPNSQAALKINTRRIPQIAAFSDDIRDGIKGHVFNDKEPGFIQGAQGFEESIKFGIVASTDHPGVRYRQVNYSKAPWAAAPRQAVAYAEAHDNLTLWDKLLVTMEDETEEELLKMHRMASAIVLTSQGKVFLHAGQDFVRTKFGDHNSYKSPDEVNRLDWERKAIYDREFQYNRGLIALRRAHPAFRMTETKDIQKHLEFLPMPAPLMVGYVLKDHANGDPWERIVVLFNASTKEQEVELEGGPFVVVVNGEQAGVDGLHTFETGTVRIPPRTSFVLVDQASYEGTK